LQVSVKWTIDNKSQNYNSHLNCTHTNPDFIYGHFQIISHDYSAMMLL